MNQSRAVQIATFGIFIFIILAIFTNSTFLTIEPGQKGVLFKQFAGGLDKETVYGQGFHVIAPWNTMIVYDTREQIREEELDVLSADGLPINIDVSIRFRPQPQKIGHLHDEIGKNYAEKIVKDLVRASAREIIGKYTPEEIYSTKRDSVRTGIESRVSKLLNEKYVELEAVNLRSVKLPSTIEDAIQRKLVQEQEKEQYQFRLEKEEKEAERRRIEAEGKAAANAIVSASLTDKILSEKGIEATLELAKSPNSKVIVVGSGKNGLPLILGGQGGN